MNQDAGHNVFRRANGQRRVEQAAVAREDMIDRDVAQPRIENSGMQQNKTHVFTRNRGDSAGVDIGPSGEIINSADHIVDAHAEEGFPDKVGAQLSR